MSTKDYDLVILGGGTGGYIAAIRASQAGKRVAIAERAKLGGTCLHKGCIPSKALLRSAEMFATMKAASEYGIEAENIYFDYNKALTRKSKVVDQLHNGVQMLMKKHNIDVYYGQGRVIGPSIFSPQSGAIAFDSEEDNMPTLVGKNTIIATGSRPVSLPGLTPDGETILTSDDALEMEELPDSIIIIGGGVIGVEWASMLHDFGVNVTIVELGDRLLPQEDADISQEVERQFKKRGIHVMTDARVDAESVYISEGILSLTVMGKHQTATLTAQRCLVCVGRSANVEGIGLENTDIKIENGVIKVNAFFQTTEKHIYAIGDCIGGLQLAHKAGHEAMMAVDHMLGSDVHPLSSHNIPRCIYSRPEIASIGLNEQEAKQRGYDIKIGKFPFQAVSKAIVSGDSEGFVKVIADRKTDDLLGVHMIGPHVTEMISEVSLAKVLEATPWEIASAIHPHPALSEVLGEAMLAVDGKAIGI